MGLTFRKSVLMFVYICLCICVGIGFDVRKGIHIIIMRRVLK